MNTTNRTLVEETHRGLARIWIDFESSLSTVPLVARMLQGRMRLEDYRSFLFNLRQQVVEGSRWISQGAASMGTQNEDLRSMFMKHAVAEHRDYRLLEDNYVASGGDREEIRSGRKNVGSEALSGFMYHVASRPDPIGMLGAMFVIETMGQRLAGPWSSLMAKQLDLPPECISFLSYHGENDGDHMAEFDEAIILAVTTPDARDEILHHARVVARLYRLQIEEIDNA